MGMKDLFSGTPPLSLAAIRFPKDLRILVLAPHPDDFDEIGVTLRFFRDNGNQIHVAVVSSGASGVQDCFCVPPTREQKSRIREQEQQESCRFFGLPRKNLSFLRLCEDAAGHVLDSAGNAELVTDCITAQKPQMVFLPHGNDSNTGHQRTCVLLRRIAAQAGFPMTAWFNKDPKTISMRYDIYTPFGEELARWKVKLLGFHRSQQHRNLNLRQHGFDERILSMNRHSARELALEERYAEVFEIEFFE